MWPRLTAKQAWRKLRSRATLERAGRRRRPHRRVAGASKRRRRPGRRGAGPVRRGAGAVLPRDRRRGPGPDPVPAAGGDAPLADGLTLVGDDAQRRRASGIGLRRAAELLDVGLEQMATAYRMSAEIADWLNAYAAGPRHRRRRAHRHPPDRACAGREPADVAGGRSRAARPMGQRGRHHAPTRCGSTRASSTTAWWCERAAMSAGRGLPGRQPRRPRARPGLMGRPGVAG